MTNLFTPPRIQFSPLDRLYFSATGTSASQAVYTDIDLTTPHPDPIVCDAEGYCDPIYLDPSQPNYRFRRTNSAGVQQELHDDIPANQTESRFFRLKHTAPYLILEETDQTAGNKKWFVRANGNQLDIGPLDDAESTFTAAATIARSGVVTIATLAATTSTVGGSSVATSESGSWTATQTGYSSNLTPTIQWRRSGSLVTLSCNSGSAGTSNSDSMTITNLPAAIQPLQALTTITRLRDNGASVVGVALISGATITFGNGIGGTLFTTSGSKGLPGNWSMTYEAG